MINNRGNNIPKIIHYCWFGDNRLPEDAKKCINSWKKYLSDFEIKEWNESNFDIECCGYVKQAYKMKKWAFVSDYARFWILYHYGGLYFDTDVEIIKDMHSIVERGAFMGCETIDKCAPGLGLGVNPGLGLYKEVLDYYQQLHFDMKNGITETVVDHTTRILKKHGWEGNGSVELIDGVYVYPPEYFCPMDYTTGRLNITDNTYTIHWYNASWQSSFSKFKTAIQHILGKDLTEKIKVLKRKLRG